MDASIAEMIDDLMLSYTPQAKTVMVRGMCVEVTLDASGHLTVQYGDERIAGQWTQVYNQLHTYWRGKYLSALRRHITMLIRA